MQTDPSSETEYFDPLEQLYGYHLRRASAVIMADLATELAPCGLTPAECSVLLVVSANSGIRQSDVGRRLGIKRANMAPLVTGLEGRDLIARAPTDGRSLSLTLTAEGETLARTVRTLIAEHEARFFGEFDAPTRAMLLKCLIKLRATAEQIAEENASS